MDETVRTEKQFIIYAFFFLIYDIATYNLTVLGTWFKGMSIQVVLLAFPGAFQETFITGTFQSSAW